MTGQTISADIPGHAPLSSNFRLLIGGQAISGFGTSVTQVALPAAAVVRLHAVPIELGAITSAEFFAAGLLSLLAGVYVDRWRRRRVMFISDVGRALVIGTVPVAVALGLLSIWQLIVVALLAGAGSVFFEIAYQAFLPSVVTRDQLLRANSKLFASSSITDMAGPGIAGVLIQLLGAARTMSVDAVSYLASLASLISMRGVTETLNTLDGPYGHPPLRIQIAEGFQQIRQDKILVSFLGSNGSYNFILVAEQALIVLFLLRTVRIPLAVLGVVLAAQGVGSVLGALLAGTLRKRIGFGKTIMLAAVAGPAFALLIPFTYPGVRLSFFVIGYLALGFTTTITKIVSGSYRQAAVPQQLLGRVVATYRTITWGPLPLAGLFGGLLGELLGPRAALLVFAILLAATPLWLLKTGIWRIREMTSEMLG
jgi:MFS family permease